MIRIMRNNRNWLGILVLLLLFVTACGRSEYRHREVGLDSAEAKHIEEMLTRIREGGEAGVEKHVRKFGAADLSADRAAGLERLFTEMTAAEAVELLDLDRFGGRVYRATLLVREAGTTRNVHVLLVENDDGLCWAGIN